MTLLGRKKVLVIPALLEGVTMPLEGNLPPEICSLTRLQALRLTDQDWDHDVERLVTALSRTLDASPVREAQPVTHHLDGSERKDLLQQRFLTLPFAGDGRYEVSCVPSLQRVDVSFGLS